MRIFAKTDIGRERKLDEDYFYASKPEDKIKLFILADGMGGYNGGEVASKMATEAARDYIQKNFAKNKESKEQIEQLMKDAMIYANDVVYKKAQDKQDLRGMGTTLDVCLIYNSRLYIGHIGDSRVYRIRKEFMRKITRDDSYVQTLIEDGTVEESKVTIILNGETRTGVDRGDTDYTIPLTGNDGEQITVSITIKSDNGQKTYY